MRIPIFFLLAQLCTPADFAVNTPTAAVPTPVRVFGGRLDIVSTPPSRLFGAPAPAAAVPQVSTAVPVPVFTPFAALQAPVGVPHTPAAVPAPVFPAFPAFGAPHPPAVAPHAPAGGAQTPATVLPAEVFLDFCKIIGPLKLTGNPQIDCVPRECFNSGGSCIINFTTGKCIQHLLEKDQYGNLRVERHSWRGRGGRRKPCTGCRCKSLGRNRGHNINVSSAMQKSEGSTQGGLMSGLGLRLGQG